MNDDILKSFLIKNPEKVFDSPYLSYKRRSIKRIIDDFDLAAEQKPVYKIVKELLRVTSNFRSATEPDGLFQELRTTTKKDNELKNIFVTMNDMLLKTESKASSLNEQDKKILQTALNYCKKSIKERMASLKSDDRLIPFWNASDLKKQVGK